MDKSICTAASWSLASAIKIAREVGSSKDGEPFLDPPTHLTIAITESGGQRSPTADPLRTIQIRKKALTHTYQFPLDTLRGPEHPRHPPTKPRHLCMGAFCHDRNPPFSRLP
ncbi:hypothetical protein CK203_059988 [Vitis vinifera]|uniref:Uncharacterized protein n=1 Tax=Vitis vinifera TaxID=29760 RepID=A0A438GFF8_VITVI|nr:hypothetical protein CK203_059988 [Vitis vinifera]